ncbi:hypothetical protein B4U79_13422 [Dinothrombium tinctorium]|uniref:Uncharacterized protein n=1 Tax=Dinothrombium tinctorium TaxID=1965070 RepID=A0A443Q632_9ACAR|nr:hypothetical protein B4U79_13422 [Dinothrombium tinctorium]
MRKTRKTPKASDGIFAKRRGESSKAIGI